MSNIKNSFNALIDSLKFNGKKKEFTQFFTNIKKTFSNNKHLSDVLKKYYSKEKLTVEDNILLKKVIKDNLKLVGIGTLSILSFPIPGSTILMLFLIKGSKKIGIDLVPSEFKKIEESMNNDNVIDITKMSSADWSELQLNVIDDCFSGTTLKVIPVKINSNKNNAATFRCRINRRTKEITDKHFTFNKMLRWTQEKLNNVMAHEMIHYYLGILNKSDGHGHYFKQEMRRINNMDNNYTVSVKDDEFIADDKHDLVMGLNFVLFERENNITSFYSTNNLSILNEQNTIASLKHYFKVKSYDVYQVSKKIEIEYSLKNRRTLTLSRFNDETIYNKIINTPSTKFIKHVDL